MVIEIIILLLEMYQALGITEKKFPTRQGYDQLLYLSDDEEYSKETTLILSAIQVFLALVGISCNVIMAIVGFSSVGEGIWCGCVFLLAGLLGFLNCYRRSIYAKRGFVIVSIFATIFTVPLFAFAIYEIGTLDQNTKNEHYPYSKISAYGLLATVAVVEYFVSIASAVTSSHGCCNSAIGSQVTPRIDTLILGKGDQLPLSDED